MRRQRRSAREQASEGRGGQPRGRRVLRPSPPSSGRMLRQDRSAVRETEDRLQRYLTRYGSSAGASSSARFSRCDATSSSPRDRAASPFHCNATALRLSRSRRKGVGPREPFALHDAVPGRGQHIEIRGVVRLDPSVRAAARPRQSQRNDGLISRIGSHSRRVSGSSTCDPRSGRVGLIDRGQAAAYGRLHVASCRRSARRTLGRAGPVFAYRRPVAARKWHLDVQRHARKRRMETPSCGTAS